MLCQVKITDIHGQPKGEKKYIQSDLPPGIIYYFTENELPRLIRVTVPHMAAKGNFAKQWLFHNQNFKVVKTINDGIKQKVTFLID